MLREFIPVLFSIGVAVAIAVGAIVVALILGKVGQRNQGKDLAYECGKDPIGGGSARFSVKFYLVAMIFILFDIEVIFMYPWAVSLMEFHRSGLGWQVFGLMLVFVLLVEVGHWYAYKKGVFDWNKRG
ncbi:MAG: NADH-quinone oxidoreductase subunit A [Verrucomicrobia bacterium]|nr:NADH-quinone oxidoreductase subunit A [Verrucomicrobiota bacterium]